MNSFPDTLARIFDRSNHKDGRSALGIDIGSSAIKIVELHAASPKARLETYGTISLSSRTAAIDKGNPSAFAASALLDLMHEVGALSKTGGMSLPFSSTFVTIIESLKREGSEAQQLIEAEARQYVPVNLGSVSLAWQALPEAKTESAFEHAEKKSSETSHKQKLLLVAVRKDTLAHSENIAHDARLAISFYETELFSTIRAALPDGHEATLFIDLGAAGSKIYIVDEKGIARATRYVEKSVNPFAVAAQMKDEYNAVGASKIAYGILSGGGALEAGALKAARDRVQLTVLSADPFSRVQGPMILEDVLRDVGPLYTVACGLALRALSS